MSSKQLKSQKAADRQLEHCDEYLYNNRNEIFFSSCIIFFLLEDYLDLFNRLRISNTMDFSPCGFIYQ